MTKANQDEVSFSATPHEREIARKIAERTLADLKIARRHDRFSKLDIEMDVIATHANGNPLRLEALLDADDFNFAHDVLGIRRHLDRETGKLTGWFSPRFSARVSAAA